MLWITEIAISGRNEISFAERNVLIMTQAYGKYYDAT